MFRENTGYSDLDSRSNAYNAAIEKNMITSKMITLDWIKENLPILLCLRTITKIRKFIETYVDIEEWHHKGRDYKRVNFYSRENIIYRITKEYTSESQIIDDFEYC